MNFAIDMTTRSCDFTLTQYDAPVRGAGMVAQGATGRYCVVMVAGPEWIADNPILKSSLGAKHRSGSKH